MTLKSNYDVIVIGAGHNGLVAACYLAKAGLEVLVLEANDTLGGATQSREVFPGYRARLSVYSYLVSLLPRKIIEELGLELHLLRRKTASWTPASLDDGGFRELLLLNDDPQQNREAFVRLTGNDQDYRGYLKLQQFEESLAQIVWPSLTEPLVSRECMQQRVADPAAWKALVEDPLGHALEQLISDDLVRGMVFTDAKIGLPTYAHDPRLLQNRCFLYHIVGQGNGQWLVPRGGMGALVAELLRCAAATGKVTFQTGASIESITSSESQCHVAFADDCGAAEVAAKFVLCNASRVELARMLGEQPYAPDAEGTGFKVNMLLKRLPRLRSREYRGDQAFCGTVHIDESYQQLAASYAQSASGQLPNRPPGEIYCHTLTDDSILDSALSARGMHTITLFGLDLPYQLFLEDNERVKKEVVRRYLQGINQVLDESIEECLAQDSTGAPCIEAMSALDLESKLRLPLGNIFHGDLSWPFADLPEDVGRWGVETAHARILLCGSAALRGGAVSGIPGHNAAQKVFEILGIQ